MAIESRSDDTLGKVTVRLRLMKSLKLYPLVMAERPLRVVNGRESGAATEHTGHVIKLSLCPQHRHRLLLLHGQQHGRLQLLPGHEQIIELVFGYFATPEVS